MKNLIFILCLLATDFVGFSQQKTEKQYRIRPSEVPAAARKLMDEHFGSNSIKWYREEDEGDISIEAKTSRKGKQFSLDFNREGEIRDVEILSSISALPFALRNKINAYLEEKFIRYKILKVQEHWNTDQAPIGQILNEDYRLKSPRAHYEVEVRGRGQKGILLYKILFGPNGTVIK